MSVKGNFCPVMSANSPLASVEAPFVVPLIDTVAPIILSLVLASNITPETVALMTGLS